MDRLGCCLGSLVRQDYCYALQLNVVTSWSLMKSDIVGQPPQLVVPQAGLQGYSGFLFRLPGYMGPEARLDCQQGYWLAFLPSQTTRYAWAYLVHRWAQMLLGIYSNAYWWGRTGSYAQPWKRLQIYFSDHVQPQNGSHGQSSPLTGNLNQHRPTDPQARWSH